MFWFGKEIHPSSISFIISPAVGLWIKSRAGDEKQGHLFLRKIHESSTNAGMCFLGKISKAGTRGYEKSCEPPNSGGAEGRKCGFNLSLKY